MENIATEQDIVSTERLATWSRIGTTLDTASVSDALKLAALDFTVTKEPIQSASGIVDESHVMAVANGKSLGIVSKKYEMVQNEDAFKFVDCISDQIRFKKAGITHDGMIYLIGKLPESEILGDKFEPYVIFRNSFNGKYQLSAAITPLRIVCENQFNFAFKEADNTILIRHSSKISDRMTEATNVLKGVATYMTALGKQAESLSKISLTAGQINRTVDLLFPLPVANGDGRIAAVNQKKESFMQMLDADDNANHRNTAWGIINAYTDYLTHKRSTRERFNDSHFMNITFNPMNSILATINTAIAA